MSYDNLLFIRVYDIEIPIVYSLISGHNIKIFKDFQRNSYTTEIKEKLNKKIIENRREILENIIKLNDGKARIFITKDILGHGHQYLRISDTSTKVPKYLTKLPLHGTKEACYVDIDLETNKEESLKSIEKLVKISMSYVISEDEYYMFGLTIKQPGSNAVYSNGYDKNIICMLNGFRFLQINQIFSIPYSSSLETGRIGYHDEVKIESYVIYDKNTNQWKIVNNINDLNFNFNDMNKLWQTYNNYYPYDLSEKNERDNLDLY